LLLGNREPAGQMEVHVTGLIDLQNRPAAEPLPERRPSRRRSVGLLAEIERELRLLYLWLMDEPIPARLIDVLRARSMSKPWTGTLKSWMMHRGNHPARRPFTLCFISKGEHWMGEQNMPSRDDSPAVDQQDTNRSGEQSQWPDRERASVPTAEGEAARRQSKQDPLQNHDR
jgi:hypothetical protein